MKNKKIIYAAIFIVVLFIGILCIKSNAVNDSNTIVYSESGNLLYAASPGKDYTNCNSFSSFIKAANKNPTAILVLDIAGTIPSDIDTDAIQTLKKVLRETNRILLVHYDNPNIEWGIEDIWMGKSRFINKTSKQVPATIENIGFCALASGNFVENDVQYRNKLCRTNLYCKNFDNTKDLYEFSKYCYRILKGKSQSNTA